MCVGSAVLVVWHSMYEQIILQEPTIVVVLCAFILKFDMQKWTSHMSEEALFVIGHVVLQNEANMKVELHLTRPVLLSTPVQISNHYQWLLFLLWIV